MCNIKYSALRTSSILYCHHWQCNHKVFHDKIMIMSCISLCSTITDLIHIWIMLHYCVTSNTLLWELVQSCTRNTDNLLLSGKTEVGKKFMWMVWRLLSGTVQLKFVSIFKMICFRPLIPLLLYGLKPPTPTYDDHHLKPQYLLYPVTQINKDIYNIKL